MTFAFGTFSTADGIRFPGLVRDDQVVRLEIASSVFALLQDWDANLPRLHRAADVASFDQGVPMTELKVHAPVDLPLQLCFTGATYRKHVIDLTIDQNV
jgi:hypothetical protein